MKNLREKLTSNKVANKANNNKITEKETAVKPVKEVKPTKGADTANDFLEEDEEEVVEEVKTTKTRKADKKAEEAVAAKKTRKPAKQVEDEEEVKPAKAKAPKGKKLNLVDVCSFDSVLDQIDAKLNAEENADTHMKLVEAINIYNTGDIMEALLLRSYALNGGVVSLQDFRVAYAAEKPKRAKRWEPNAVFDILKEGKYTAEDVLAMVPETEDEAYYFLLFIENGWNNMGKLAIKGKAREALAKYMDADK